MCMRRIVLRILKNIYSLQRQNHIYDTYRPLKTNSSQKQTLAQLYKTTVCIPRGIKLILYFT